VLPDEGRIVASAGVRPETWACALPREAVPLVLAPGSARGWVGGRALVAWAPEFLTTSASLGEAAAELELSFRAETPCLTAALLPYDGPAVIARYTGGLVRTARGWRAWGTLDPADVPSVDANGRSALALGSPLADGVQTDLDGRAFRAGVHAVREAIRAGDVYVLNLTRRLAGSPLTASCDAFAALVSRAQADMAAFWETPCTALASASPERFIRVSGDLVQVCPVKGTRPRAEQDDIMVAELGASEKERAEHVMIVDLERNDLGRVCRPGTVTVDPLFEVVTTPYCHQMESSVFGTLRAEASLGEVLQAVFPCGSVTGAPKIAAMSTIARLEASPRGAYTGSLVVAIPGEIDSSVLIRTAEYVDGVVRWGTGGGITIDSESAEEWLETVLKASPFLGDGLPGVALRETCRVVQGRVPLLARHLGRLAAGGCGPTTLARVRAAASEAIAAGAAAHGRLSVTVHPTGEVRSRTSGAMSSLVVPGGPVPVPIECATPHLPAGAAKPADRALWDGAQRAAHALGGHQAVLIDARGSVTDGATASVWVRVGRHLLTPPAPPAVDGVGRSVVFDFAAECGYVAEEADVPAELLARADEVFFSNALAGVVSARDRGGPAAAALRDVFRVLFGE
jgi:para-aminobenzoate synthetase/4-amino-4-deoxychorismate lyase